MFLDHENPGTSFRLEETQKCEVLYPGSGLLHDHVGRLVLVLKKGNNAGLRIRIHFIRIRIQL